MSKILVTGARGLLGCEFRDILTDKEAFFADKSKCDITDLESITKCINNIPEGISAIINCAADRNAENMEDNPKSAELITVEGPKNLALIANKYQVPLIHFSSDYVFSGDKNCPYLETDKTKALNVYGEMKIKGEKAILELADTCIIFRTAWIFSSYGKDFVKTIINLGSRQSEINVIFDQVGSPTYGADLAKWVVQILPKIKKNTKEIYHLTNEGVCSWYDLAHQTKIEMQLKCKIIPIHTSEYKQKAQRPHYSVLDKIKFKKEFKIELRHYSEALHDCCLKIKDKNNE